MGWIVLMLAAAGMLFGLRATAQESRLDLTRAVVVIGTGGPSPERTAAEVLVEEVERRTGLKWPVVADWPSDATVVLALTATQGIPGPSPAPPRRPDGPGPESRPEGFRLVVETPEGRPPMVWFHGADGRGVFYAVGRFLCRLDWGPGRASLDTALDEAAAPAYPIRGHQLGYRNTANSYDAWDAAQYDRHIRELALFGANCIENIPLAGGTPSPLMPLPRNEMNIRIAEICERYDVDHWVWTPVAFGLEDEARRREALEEHGAFFDACPRLDAVFIPGGDPGDNPPKLLMPYAAELADRLHNRHPNAAIWISLQGFDRDRVDAFHAYVEQRLPDWLGGVVAGPSSPCMAETRRRLPARYPIRHYPDITHNLVCQYPVYWWDQAFASTLGREGPNPQPAWYTHVHNWFAPYTQGFLTYSDGAHDDVNKAIWTRLGWDPATTPRDITLDYVRFFFGPERAEAVADGILALEKNWEGVLANNGGVEATLAFWLELDAAAPHLHGDWRWQFLVLRAYYDAYVRRRLLCEQRLEQEACAALAGAPRIGADTAMDAALAILERPPGDDEPELTAWRKRIDELCEALFASIGYQSSVERFQASGGERSSILDYVDVPLNNRWWLEDEFARIRGFASEREKLERLEVIRTWEQPAPGSRYDNIGNVAQMPHVALPPGPWVHPDKVEARNPHLPWTDNGFSRKRRSWLCMMRWPASLDYRGLDPGRDYAIRATGPGDLRPRANGELLTPSLYSRDEGEFKEFPVPRRLLESGELTITFDDIDESHLNWRLQSYLAEVWLIPR